jgi:hypothetical protein
MPSTAMSGDLNNTFVMRSVARIEVDPQYSYQSLAISREDDEPIMQKKYRPFILDPQITAGDWISRLELSMDTL